MRRKKKKCVPLSLRTVTQILSKFFLAKKNKNNNNESSACSFKKIVHILLSLTGLYQAFGLVKIVISKKIEKRYLHELRDGINKNERTGMLS